MKNLKLILFFTAIALLNSCSKESREDFESDFSKYTAYITSFSSGIVSSKSDIQVGLTFAKKGMAG